LVWAHASKAAPLSTEAQSFIDLLAVVSQATEDVALAVGRIDNRSRLFDADIARFRGYLAWMRTTNAGGVALVGQADRERDPAARKAKLERAAVRLEALVLAVRVLALQVDFEIVASAAENAGQVSTQWQDQLHEVDRKTGPVLDAAESMDRGRMEVMARAHRIEMDQLRAEVLPRWLERLHLGAEWSRKSIKVADYASMVVGAYESYGAIRAMGGGGGGITFTFPGIGGVAGGAAEMTAVTIRPEVLEALRHLVQIGAISNTVLSAGLGPSAALPELTNPGLLFRATPTGTVRPTAGKFKGQKVTYGDDRGRGKHTKVANYTLDELKEALRQPNRPKNKLLDEFIEAVRKRNTDYGSQLSKEATDRYEQLVKQALESGIEKDGKLYVRDSIELGIDVKTGKPTHVYGLVGAPDEAHIFPVQEDTLR